MGVNRSWGRERENEGAVWREAIDDTRARRWACEGLKFGHLWGGGFSKPCNSGDGKEKKERKVCQIEDRRKFWMWDLAGWDMGYTAYVQTFQLPPLRM